MPNDNSPAPSEGEGNAAWPANAWPAQPRAEQPSMIVTDANAWRVQWAKNALGTWLDQHDEIDTGIVRVYDALEAALAVPPNDSSNSPPSPAGDGEDAKPQWFGGGETALIEAFQRVSTLAFRSVSGLSVEHCAWMRRTAEAIQWAIAELSRLRGELEGAKASADRRHAGSTAVLREAAELNQSLRLQLSERDAELFGLSADYGKLLAESNAFERKLSEREKALENVDAILLDVLTRTGPSWVEMQLKAARSHIAPTASSLSLSTDSEAGHG